tara:strand:- start:2223 stop:3884 length:1662 start_codon:yes stop_codon:yes gene_type:complete
MSDRILLTTATTTYSQREQCTYSIEEEDVNKLKTKIIKTELKLLIAQGRLNIYNNQESISEKVVTEYKYRKTLNIMVISKPQTGKTGSMIATIKLFLEHNVIPIDNIYIITGLSSKDWCVQTKNRVMKSLEDRVFHLPELKSSFVDDLKGKKNVLIIMDEVQVAAKNGQTVHEAFRKAGLLDKNKLYENDIKILEYTATPDGVLDDLVNWGEASEKIIAEAGKGYRSSYDLLGQGRVRQYQELCGYNKDTGLINQKVYDNIREFKVDVDNFDEPMYHIVRTKTGQEQEITVGNFKKVFEENNYNLINFDMNSKVNNVTDINELLSNKPEKHTIIFIKEMLRCAKTLTKKFIGVVYERYSANPDDAVIIQSLVGRLSGYDDNGVSICYTNIDSIERYEKYWNSKFEDNTIPWNSKTTKRKRGITYGNNTFNDARNFGFENSVSINATTDITNTELVIIKKKTQDEIKEYHNKNMKQLLDTEGKPRFKRGPNKKKPNADGYYSSTLRSKTKIYSCDEIYADRRQGLNAHTARYYACYEDVNDPSTLEFWLIYEVI